MPVVEASQVLAGADVIKLDIEGAEFDNLVAVLEIIRSARPALIIEVNRDTPILRNLMASLCRDSGYTMYAISPDGLPPIDPEKLRFIDFKRQFHTRDVLLTV